MNRVVPDRLIDSLRTHTPDERPYKFLFVCGHMRSGTNWICNILRGHPDISVHGEGPFGHICGSIVQAKKLSWLYSSRDQAVKQVLDESFADLVRNVMLQLAAIEPEKSWIAESTSRQLWPYIPGAHHIHIQRDVRDVLTSWTFHQLGLGLPIGEPWATRLRPQAEALAANPNHFKERPQELFTDEAWVRFVVHGWVEFMITADYVRRAAAEGKLDIKLLDLTYEDMLADTAAAQRQIFAFMDLDPSVATPLSAEHRTAAGFDREDPSSHFRAGRRGDWERYATDDFRCWIKDVAGEILINTGYEKNLDW